LSGAWRFLAEIPATPNPSLVIKHSELGDGEFDLAVSMVNARGDASTLHSSLDATANPFGGWYLVWSRSER
jgi:hypothetical protein